MYNFVKGNYIYRGTYESASPIKEIKTITDKEAKYWDNIDKQIRRLERNK